MTLGRTVVAVGVIAAALLANGDRWQRAAHAQECVGACFETDMVTVRDLVTGVNIALGERPLSDCPSFDADGDLSVGVNEILQGVINALEGCGPHIVPDRCELSPPLIPVPIGPGISFDLEQATRDFGDPVLSCGCADSPHTMWAQFTASASATATFRVVAGSTDTTLAVLSGRCGSAAPLACVVGDTAAARVSLPVSAGMTYLVELSPACGSAGSVVQLAVDVCGDGVVSDGEECDGGNQVAGDGCSAQCTFENLGGIDGRTCDEWGGDINVLYAEPIGQVFAPVDPLLAAVDLLLDNTNDIQMDTLTLNVHAASITGAIAGTTTLTVTTPLAAWAHFEFAAPVAVVPGQPYVVELVATNSSINWQRCSAATGGAIFSGETSTNRALSIRTYAARPG